MGKRPLPSNSLDRLVVHVGRIRARLQSSFECTTAGTVAQRARQSFCGVHMCNHAPNPTPVVPKICAS
eukprot:938845-Amphidinium_carterae.1